MALTVAAAAFLATALMGTKTNDGGPLAIMEPKPRQM